MPPYPPKMADADFEQLIQGQQFFAKGTGREAFNVPSDSLVVVKKQRIPFPGANFLELFIWNAVSQTALKNTFGACLSISETGKYLMMERLEDITQADLHSVPEVPLWLDDRKINAFGKTPDGTVKVRDYSMVHLDRFLALTTSKVSWAK